MTKGITVNAGNIESIIKSLIKQIKQTRREPKLITFVVKRTDRYRGKGRPRKSDYQTTDEIIEEKFGVKAITGFLGK